MSVFQPDHTVIQGVSAFLQYHIFGCDPLPEQLCCWIKIPLQLLLHIHAHLKPTKSIWCCLYVHVFRTDHLELANLSNGLYLEKPLSPSLSFPSRGEDLWIFCYPQWHVN